MTKLSIGCPRSRNIIRTEAPGYCQALRTLTERTRSSRGLYLQWEGKKIYRQIVPTPQLLEPVEKYSHGSDRTNMLIEGDNLQVLASLKPRYSGQIGLPVP